MNIPSLLRRYVHYPLGNFSNGLKLVDASPPNGYMTLSVEMGIPTGRDFFLAHAFNTVHEFTTYFDRMKMHIYYSMQHRQTIPEIPIATMIQCNYMTPRVPSNIGAEAMLTAQLEMKVSTSGAFKFGFCGDPVYVPAVQDIGAIQKVAESFWGSKLWIFFDTESSKIIVLSSTTPFLPYQVDCDDPADLVNYSTHNLLFESPEITNYAKDEQMTYSLSLAATRGEYSTIRVTNHVNGKYNFTTQVIEDPDDDVFGQIEHYHPFISVSNPTGGPTDLSLYSVVENRS